MYLNPGGQLREKSGSLIKNKGANFLEEPIRLP